MLSKYPAPERGSIRGEKPVKTIMLATDGSEAASDALDVAITIAKETGATLQVLSVRPPRPAGRGGVGPAMLEVEELHGPEHIAEAAAQPAHGDVVTCIVDAATAYGADLLVVGSRGLGSLSGAVLGSVSHALVHRSPVPVTIVRHAAVHAAAGS
jgi:nucleotide-binding universal stress UspA family protein